MKEYPKILGPSKIEDVAAEHCIAFDKLDGSNLRFEWNPRSGWYKFGTRRRLFDHTDPEYGCAIDLFLNKYADGVEKAVRDNFRKVENMIAYAEFFGPHSFAGKHDATFLRVESNDPKQLVLFDVNVHKRGFIPPRQFVDLFSSLGTPAVIYEGPFTEAFIQDVRNGKYDLVEGVIAKGGEGHDLWYRKVKTLKYLEKLKEVFGTGWEQYGE